MKTGSENCVVVVGVVIVLVSLVVVKVVDLNVVVDVDEIGITVVVSGFIVEGFKFEEDVESGPTTVFSGVEGRTMLSKYVNFSVDVISSLDMAPVVSVVVATLESFPKASNYSQLQVSVAAAEHL